MLFSWLIPQSDQIRKPVYSTLILASSRCGFLGSAGKYLIPTMSPTLLITWEGHFVTKTHGKVGKQILSKFSNCILYTKMCQYDLYIVNKERKIGETNNVKSKVVKKHTVKSCTSKAFTMSSRVWAAEMHIRALPNSRGVAGKPTVTTANCGHKN